MAEIPEIPPFQNKNIENMSIHRGGAGFIPADHIPTAEEIFAEKKFLNFLKLFHNQKNENGDVVVTGEEYFSVLKRFHNMLNKSAMADLGFPAGFLGQILNGLDGLNARIDEMNARMDGLSNKVDAMSQNSPVAEPIP